MARPRVWVQGLDDRGLVLFAAQDRPLDVCIDGRRVWTFWSLRDTDRWGGVPGPLRRAAWPGPLVRHLHGRARITVRDPASPAVFLDREVSLGSGEGRIEVRNRDGVELGFDKSGKLVPTFAGRSERDIDALLDATEAVVAALEESGLAPFLAYGTLLGAVREGHVLGHDSDADLGYVSRFSDPVDVSRESFRVQRHLTERGWSITRYSGSAFKVEVSPQPGVRIGLDVFGGFFDAGRLYLMGEVGTEFEREWIDPLGRCDLDGRSMPVPARPEKLLEAMYGAGWRVPDPAFKFTTPPRTVRALEDWFRGTQPRIRYWERRASTSSRSHGFREPSQLARRAATAARERGAEVLDVGAGRGADSLWIARQGVPVTALDYVPRALASAQQAAARAGDVDLQVRQLNLTEWRSVLTEGARLAHDPRPRVVLARHVLDATSEVGRGGLVRLCAMALRSHGGLLLADFHVTAEDEEPDDSDWLVGRVDVGSLTRLLEHAGAQRVAVRRLEGRSRPTLRLVGEWTHAAQPAPIVAQAGGDPTAGAAGR